MSGQIAMYSCDSRVATFATIICEGSMRLYKNGVFIPSPRVGYLPLHDHDKAMTVNTNAHAHVDVTVGDFTYGAIHALFVLKESSNPLERHVKGENVSHRSVGRRGVADRLVRVAYWSDDSSETVGTLEQEGNGDMCHYVTVAVRRTDYIMLTEHYCRRTPSIDDVVSVINKQMFLFD